MKFILTLGGDPMTDHDTLQEAFEAGIAILNEGHWAGFEIEDESKDRQVVLVFRLEDLHL